MITAGCTRQTKMTQTDVLFIEPYYGGSHKQLVDLLVREFGGTLFTLPPTKWHWRTRVSALHFADTIPEAPKECKTLFASSVLNLCELVALRPDLGKLNKVLYFHENQLIYPVRKQLERDFQYGYNQILSCLLADVILFNSHFNMASFLDSIPSFLKLIPDHRPTRIVERIRGKCRVAYFPLEPNLHHLVQTPEQTKQAFHANSPQAGTTDAPQTRTTDAPQTGTIDALQTSTTDPPQTGTTDAPQTGTTDAPQTGTTNAPQTSTTDPPQTGTTDAPQTGTTDAPQTGTTNAPQTSTTDPPQTGTTDAPQTGTTNAPQTSTTDPPQTSTTDASQLCSSTLLLPQQLNCLRTVPCLHILWPHRWEHDKGPDEFCVVLTKLLDARLDFVVSILGSHTNDIPASIQAVIPLLGSRLLHKGSVPQQDYWRILTEADVVVSTAKHEFFGVAMLEASYCGCYPLCPNRLVYPEIYPEECLYNTEQQLFKRLRAFCLRPTLARTDLQIRFDRFQWGALKLQYKHALHI
ncbi:hypothetical protein EMCRGX_G020501 [Ephydatia muelleri]